MAALVTLIIGFIGWNGASRSAAVFGKKDRAQTISIEILQWQVDHLNWAKKVEQAIRHENASEIDVEKDGYRCDMGKWYYGEGRKTAETELPEIKELLAKTEDPHRNLHHSAQELEKLLKKGKEFRKEAMAYYQAETLDHSRNIQKILKEIEFKLEQRITDSANLAEKQADRFKFISGLSTIIGSIIVVFLEILINFSITKPIKQVINGLSESSEQVTSAAFQVSSSNQSLAQGASEQAAGLEQTSSSIEKMSLMTKQNADNAHQANIMIKDTSRVVDEANQAI